MPDHFLHRVFDDPTFPSLEIAVRIDSLERYLGLLLEFVPHMQDQTKVRFAATLERRRAYLAREDLEDEIAHTESVAHELIPTSFYGAFVLAVFAALEQSILEIAKYVKAAEGSPLAIGDLREQGTIRRLELYLQTLLRESLAVSPQVSAEVRALQLVRNIMAHANGSLSGQPEKRMNELTQLVTTGGDLAIENFTLVIQAEFLSRSLKAADTFLMAVLGQVDRHYSLGASAA